MPSAIRLVFAVATRAVPAVLVTALLALAPPAAPHEDVDLQIAELTRAIAEDAGDASLYLQRAELLRHHRHWDEAFEDLRRAAELDAQLEGLTLGRARVAADAGLLAESRELLQRQLAQTPDDAEVHRLLARVLARLGQRDAALAEWDTALHGLASPQPDDYMARMEVALATGTPPGDDTTAADVPDAHAAQRERIALALDGLDEGLQRLGPVPALQLAAIELEVARGFHDRALVRLDLLAEHSPRRERWLAQRGDLLAAAGRPSEAATARRAALAAIAALPRKYREARATIELRARLQSSLAR